MWGDLRVSLITSDLIRVYINDARSKWSNSHTKNMIKYINKVLNFCLDKNYISRNPLPKFKLKSNQKLKTVLNEGQIKELLIKARLQNHDWYSIWATALFIGMRNGELYALKWENVSFDSNLINVCVSWNREDGYKSTKSGHDRYVEMAKPLRVIFQELKLSNHNSEFVLPRIVRWDKGEQARIVRDFLSSIGLPEIRFHDLRACWATLLLSKGVEPIKLMKIGGWSDLKTMERYVRQAGVDIKGVSSCLDDIHDPRGITGKILNLLN